MSIFTISNFSSKLLSFFLVPLYTSILSTTDYGNYDIIMTTLALAIPILTLNICDGVVRFSMDQKEDKTNVATVGLMYIVLAIVLCMLIIGLNSFVKLTDIFAGFELLVVLYFAANLLYQYLSSFAKGLEKVFEIGVAGVISTFSTIVFNIVFLVWLRLGIASFFLANILGMLIPSVYFSFCIKIWNYLSLKTFDKDLMNRMVAYSMPLVLTALSWTINDSLDKYVVRIFLGASATGILAISYKIPSILNIVQNIFTQAWQISAISEKGGKNTPEFYSKIFLSVNFLMSFCCAGLIFLSKPISYFLFSNDFFEAWKYVPALLMASLFNCASGILGPMLAVKKDSKSMAKSAIFGSIANFVFNVIFVQLWFTQGTVIATAISSFIIYFIRKIHCKDMLVKDIDKYIYLSWFILVVQAVVQVNLGNYFIEAILILLLLFVNRGMLQSVVDKLLRRV